VSGPNGEDANWAAQLGMTYVEDPGPVPPPADPDPLFQSIPPRAWTRVLLPWMTAPHASPLWVRNDADEHTFVTIGRDGTVGLQGGEGIRWLVQTGEKHPDLR